MTQAADLALVAGRGVLPRRVLNACEAAGRSVTVCGIADFDGDLPRNDRPFRLETLGTLIAELAASGVREVCLAGAVQRPRIDPAAIDAATLPIATRVAGALSVGGDDSALRMFIAFFEEAGLVVRAATDLVPDLLPAEGVPSEAQPADANGRDADRGAEVIKALSSVDLGQSCVVCRGQVIAVEALPGTDWMLKSLAEVPPELGAKFAAGGLLYKAPKPGQDRRVDLPAIGPQTIMRAAAAGLQGIVIEAGGVMVLDQFATIAAANEAGLFLWVRP